MAFVHRAPNSSQTASEVIHQIDDCMDALQKQLNRHQPKNPRSRFHNNHGDEEKQPHKRQAKQRHNRYRQTSRSEQSFGSCKPKKIGKMKASVYFSKRLTYYLRHHAEAAGLRVRRDGYVRLDALLEMREFKENGASLDTIQALVRDNDKQRFSLSREAQTWWIRANQGHSMKCVDASALLRRMSSSDIERFPVVCHGTYCKAWKLIERQGLKSMRRNHIHFVPSDAFKGSGVISGMRSSCQLLIYVDLHTAMRDGIDFFVSQNNVILSAGIGGVLAPKYFEKLSLCGGCCLIEKRSDACTGSQDFKRARQAISFGDATGTTIKSESVCQRQLSFGPLFIVASAHHLSPPIAFAPPCSPSVPAPPCSSAAAHVPASPDQVLAAPACTDTPPRRA